MKSQPGIVTPSLTWAEDHVPVVETSLGVHDALLSEPSGEHVLAVDLAPEVPVILSVVPH